MLISKGRAVLQLNTEISGDGRRQRRAIEHFICNACFHFTSEIPLIDGFGRQIMKMRCCRVPDCKVLKHKGKLLGNLLAGGMKADTWQGLWEEVAGKNRTCKQVRNSSGC